jgi:sec-independent protein translocase protein TatA
MEIAIVLVIALIVFGPKRLPELGKSLGRGISEFKQGVSSIGDSVSGDHKHDDDHEPVELSGSQAGPQAGPRADDEPEVTEVKPSPSPQAEAVDGEVVADRQN